MASIRAARTLLIVDDEERLPRALGRTLRQEDCETRSAASGEEALDLLDKTKIDLVITDPVMPGMHGLTPEGAVFAEQVADIERAKQAEELAHTITGRIGHAIAPVLRPTGFDWRIATGFFGALVAKEVFVTQLGIVCSVGEADAGPDPLRPRLRESYTPLQAFCIVLFLLISAPCMATLAITKRESNSWEWAILQWSGLTALALVLTTLVYQAGCYLGVSLS